MYVHIIIMTVSCGLLVAYVSVYFYHKALYVVIVNQSINQSIRKVGRYMWQIELQAIKGQWPDKWRVSGKTSRSISHRVKGGISVGPYNHQSSVNHKVSLSEDIYIALVSLSAIYQASYQYRSTTNQKTAFKLKNVM